MSMVSSKQLEAGERLPLTGAFILGFSFSAFFDGILLHQVLQWHHLFSLVQRELFRDMRVQILADGLFHVASYLLAVVGLLLLWRGRRAGPADRMILAWAVLGFAGWQFADIILVHWAIGLHRTRIDVPVPLLWDIGWLVAFGFFPLIVALWLLRDPPRSGFHRTGRSSRMIMSLAIISAGTISALPLGGGTTAVIFKEGIEPAEAFAAVASAGGRVIWSDPRGEIMIIDLQNPISASLYARGALLVTSAAWFGCFAPASAAAARASLPQT
jgi:uncharacterized membrane protein